VHAGQSSLATSCLIRATPWPNVSLDRTSNPSVNGCSGQIYDGVSRIAIVLILQASMGNS
jgi:hypothetical protein